MKTVDYGDFVLHHGNNLDVLRSLPANSVDSIVTDPPYGLGTEPDALAMLSDWITHDHHAVSSKRGFMGKEWDAFVPQPAQWRECLRVLKPGGHLLTFAGTRTQDLVALGLRIAGFEIRDMIAWVYGSGFPKSLDVSKALDKAAGAEREVVGIRESYRPKANATRDPEGFQDRSDGAVTLPPTDAARQWQGWGTALKPALEPITVARKPLVGTVAENVLAHGTGALNIDGCRVDLNGDYKCKANGRPSQTGLGDNYDPTSANTPDTVGRWPANLIHDGSDEVLAGFPDGAPAKAGRTGKRGGSSWHGCEGFGSPEAIGTWPADPGGSAARFFYCAKASKSDRGDGNTHPTVKPTDLMRYLCRLVTPPGGTVLDPWMGSGSTGKAAVPAGFRFIGVDRDDWLDLAARRIATAHWGPWVFGGAA